MNAKTPFFAENFWSPFLSEILENESNDIKMESKPEIYNFL